MRVNVHLRPWESTDAEALAKVYAHADDALLTNLPDDRSVTGAATWLEKILAAEAEGTAQAFAIVGPAKPNASVRSETSRAGRGLSEASRAASPGAAPSAILGSVMASGIERRHSTAWISYWLAPHARGRGVASSALRTLVDVLHDDLGVYRLELGYRVNNPSSRAVAAAAGFLVEGRERERLDDDGVRFDTEVAARLTGDPRSPGHRLPVRSRPGT